MTDILDSAPRTQEAPKLIIRRVSMPPYGPYGPRLKALPRKKFSRELPRKKQRVGSIPAVNLGLMTAGESATPNLTKRSRTCPRSKCGPDIQLSFLLFRVNRVPIILISFRNRFLAFTPTIT